MNTTAFKSAVFVCAGKHDYATSHTLAAEWFERIQVKAKKLFWFENSAHMTMQEEPGRFLYRLSTDVRPIASAAGDAYLEQ